jgi:hypothetical protein
MDSPMRAREDNLRRTAYLKLELADQFIVNLETDSDNSSSDTEPISDTEMSGVDPLDS